MNAPLGSARVRSAQNMTIVRLMVKLSGVGALVQEACLPPSLIFATFDVVQIVASILLYHVSTINSISP
jgi:hypothetical protein